MKLFVPFSYILIWQCHHWLLEVLLQTGFSLSNFYFCVSRFPTFLQEKGKMSVTTNLSHRQQSEFSFRIFCLSEILSVNSIFLSSLSAFALLMGIEKWLLIPLSKNILINKWIKIYLCSPKLFPSLSAGGVFFQQNK